MIPRGVSQPAPRGSASFGSRQRVLTVATASWFTISICYLGIGPVYPDIARDLSLAPDVLGAIIGISFLVSALLQIPSGILADKLGLRRFIIIGVVSMGAAAALLGLAAAPFMFALAQLAMAVSIPALQAGSITAVVHAYSGARQASAMSYIWTSSSLGLAGSLVLYGVVGGAVGWRPVALGLSLLPLVMVPLILSMPTVGRSDEDRTLVERTAESLRFLLGREALAIALISTLAMTGAIAALFLMPFALRSQSYGPGATGLLLLSQVVGSVIGTPIVGHLADRYGVARPLAVSFLLGAFALAVLAVGAAEPVVTVGCLTMLGGVMTGGQALLQSMTADLARTMRVGTAGALGGMRLAQSVGPTVGPTLAAVVFIRWGAGPALLGVAILMLIAAGLAVRMLKRPGTHLELGVPIAPA